MKPCQEQAPPPKARDATKPVPDSLPKPLRTFNYFFFGTVLVVTIVGWFATAGH